MSTWRTLRQNPRLWDRYFLRETAYRGLRAFFVQEKFHEVETPLLISHPPAESYLDVFETQLLDRNRNRMPAYLSTSPEVPLKKLLVAGIGNCFSLTKSFRNMEIQGTLHNPEFTILEWYRAGATYCDIMDDCERLVLALHAQLGGVGHTRMYQGKNIDLGRPWERISVAEAFRRWAHVDMNDFFDEKQARKIAVKKGYRVETKTTWEELYNQIFLNEVEGHLGRGKPTILYDFPAAMGALARKDPDDPRFARRFEFYIEGLELGDCYDELTDPEEQEARFKHELAEIRRMGKTAYEYDHDFIDALSVGLPACSGIAVGMDRLLMFFADVTDVADVLFFPATELFPSV